MELQQPLSWSHLPDVCLLLVFKKLSTRDMIRSVGRVCTNWGKVQRVDLRSRNKLVIATVRPRDNFKEILEEVRQYDNPFGSNLIEHVRREDGLPWVQLKPLDQIEFNTLRVPSDVLTEAFTSLVMDTLPNITHLTLVMYVPFDLSISSLHQLTRLISHYTTSLVSLKLYFDSDLPVNASRINSENILPLFNSINRLESLRHLRLNIANLVHSYPPLSILSRLATFTSDISYPAQSLLASLRQYATGDYLRVECCSRIAFNALIGLDPQLTTKFTRLNNLYFDRSLHHNMRLFCQRFVSLHSLGLAITGMSITVLTQHLSQLPELINLKLYLEELSRQLLPDEEEDYPPQLEITPLPSIRLLSLTMITGSHHDTEPLHQIFPNVQVLHFRHSTVACDECHFDYADFNTEPTLPPELRTRIVNCMHLARQPLRQCANLHIVKLDTDVDKFRSLLPQGLITRDQL